MPRTYSVTQPGYHETWMNGSLLSEAQPTQRIEALNRADVVRGQRDLWDGFKYPNPYWMTYVHDNRPYGRWKVKRFGRDYDYRYALGNVANFASWPARYLPEVPSSAQNDALIKALTKLKDQKVNLAVALAEASSVADMIATNATRIYQGLRHLKARRFKKAFRAIRHTPRKGWDKELASRILEFQYGVRPLIADIYGSMQAVMNAQYGPDRIGSAFKVEGRVSSGGDGMYTWERDESGYLPVRGSTSDRWEVRVVLWFSPKNSLLKTASEVGMINPLAVAWELLPFSCVIDWAWPCGDWLNTLDAATGMEFRGGTCTTWRETATSYQGLKSSGTNGISELSGSYKQRSMNRTVYSSLPYPTPPVLKNPVSLERALNALALLTSFR